MRTRFLTAVLALSATLVAQVRWKQRTASRTQSLSSFTFAHDTRRDVYLNLVYDYVARKLEMWQLRGNTWSMLAPKTMPVFNGAKTVYDPRRDRVVLLALLGNRSETWEWDGTDWKLRTGVQTPLLLGNFQLVFDDARAVVTSVSGVGNRIVVHDYDGVSWKQRQVTNAPSPRHQFACAFSHSGALLLFGGANTTTFVAETWLLAGSRWLQIPGPGPAGRVGAGMCYDPTRHRFVLMGGRTVSGRMVVTLSDTWEWNGKWTERQRTNSTLAREGHFMLWDPIRERSVAFAGNYTWGGGDVIKSSPLDSSFDYGPDRPARLTSYGRDCQSTRTAPRVAEVTRPWIGEALAFSVTGVAASTPLLLLTGSSRTQWGNLQLPLDLTPGMRGCFLNTSPDLVAPIQTLVRYVIPSDRRLVGLRYFHQVGAIDAAANAVGLVLSSGVELQVGEG